MEMITREEAKRRVAAIAATIPGAKAENHATCTQVRLASRELVVVYNQVTKGMLADNPAMTYGMFFKAY
jgi:hypothetical protein